MAPYQQLLIYTAALCSQIVSYHLHACGVNMWTVLSLYEISSLLIPLWLFFLLWIQVISSKEHTVSFLLKYPSKHQSLITQLPSELHWCILSGPAAKLKKVC